MASDYDFASEGDYHDTNTYRDANRDKRRQLNKYKKENNISDEQMFLLLIKQDLENVPQDKRQGADTVSLIVLIVGILIFWNSLSAASSNPGGFDFKLWILAFISFGLVLFTYYSGVMNQYKRAVRRVNKLLKDMPEVPDFNEWAKDNPIKK